MLLKTGGFTALLLGKIMSKKSNDVKAVTSNAPKETIFCPWCQKNVTFHTKQLDHRKELIRTIFSCGLWTPFWLMLHVASKSKLCDECGNSLKEYDA
jgi:hypothetical protein